jgi:hypothetical protein
LLLYNFYVASTDATQPRKDNVMTDTSKALLAASIRVRMFAKRDTIDEALNYAIEVFDRVNGNDRAAVYTVLHVVLNTVADKIDALPDSSAAALEPPPAEVRIDHADLPATGATSLHDQIEEIVLAQISKLGASIDQKIERAIEEWSENAPFDTIIEEWFEDNVDIEHSVKDIISNLSISIDVE